MHVSTDEVYGALPLEPASLKFTETTPLAPRSPYAATKAASDLLVLAACETHDLDASVTRCSNNFGPYQFPEKVIPLFVTNLLDDKRVPLYGDGQNVRDWLHVVDHCEAVLRVLEAGAPGEVYNVGGDNERTNLELTQSILKIMGKNEGMIERVKDRPGHDRRYAIDASKIGARARLASLPLGLARSVGRDREVVRRTSGVVRAGPERGLPRLLPEAVCGTVRAQGNLAQAPAPAVE